MLKLLMMQSVMNNYDPTVITGQTAETSIATDDLILLSDTSASGALRKMTRANFVSGVGGTNTPAFFAIKIQVKLLMILQLQK